MPATPSSQPPASNIPTPHTPEPERSVANDRSYGSHPTPAVLTPETELTLSSSPAVSPSQNTPRNISQASSNDNYVLLLNDTDACVPDSVVYVQNPLYERPNDDFNGRNDVLSDMDTTLLFAPASKSSKLPKTCVVCGPGGMGKTQTTLQYFHSRQAHFDVRLWVQANNVESLQRAFQQVAIQLGLQGLDSAKQHPDQSPKLVVDWLRKPRQESWKTGSRLMKWLFVFDNVIEDRVLTNFWPAHAEGSIIITTRDPIIRDSRGSVTGRISLLPLSEPDAVAMLRKRLPERLWRGETEDALVRVVQALGCWPLAIVQMAGKMCRLSQMPSRFLRNYQKQPRRAKYYEQLENDQDGYWLSLSSLWSLDDLEFGAARLLSVISLLLPESIPEFVLEDTMEKVQLDGYPGGEDEFDWAMSELGKSSLINRVASSTGQEVTIHSLIQEVIRSQLLTDEHRFIDVFNGTVRLLMAVWDHQSIPTTRYRELKKASRWERCNTLLPHLSQLRRMHELLPLPSRHSCVTEQFLYLMNEVGWYVKSQSYTILKCLLTDVPKAPLSAS